MGLHIFPKKRELTWLTGLFASFNSFSNLSVLVNLPQLERVDFRGNQIIDIHPLRTLKRLKYLDLAGNRIQNLSPLESLGNLEILYLCENQISDISPMKTLSKLQRLFLSENQLTDIRFLQKAKNIFELDISKNEITDISVISNFLNLRRLDATNNLIADLPLFDANETLEKIYLGNNIIHDLTPLKKLIENGVKIKKKDKEHPNLSLNPLTIPPPEIVDKGNSSILNYFSEIVIQGSEEIFEAKLLIVGEGGVGKTSLARKMENSNSLLPEEDESTMGINVRQLQVMKMPHGKPFLLNIWDFGGQEIYHSTHQFFLTHRSLYILVDDTRKDAKSVNDEAFSYWLQVVELLGGNSPLLIVQNEKSDRRKQIDLKSMQARFNFIKDSIPTNLATNRGLDDVIEAVKHWLSRLEHVGETLPTQWVRIRKKINSLSKNR